MAFDLYRYKASNSTGIVFYFKELVTQQMCESKAKRSQNWGMKYPLFWDLTDWCTEIKVRNK